MSGEGFDQRPAGGGYLAFRLNDGNLKFPQDQGEATVSDADGRGDVYAENDLLPDAAGDWSATIRIPDNLEPGYYWVRILSGGDGGPQLTKYAWFKVVEELSAEDPDDSEAPEGTASVESSDATTAANGNVSVRIEAKGFGPGATLSATLGDTALTFQVGRTTEANVTADEDGAYSGTVVIPAGLAPAGPVHTVTVSDRDNADSSASVDISPTPAVRFRDARGTGDVALGTTVSADISNLADGVTVDFLGAGEHNFIEAPVSAADGAVALPEVVVPSAADLLGRNVEIRYTYNGESLTRTLSTKVNPNTDAQNIDGFDMSEQKLPAGLYQSAFSAQENAVYVTRAVGRPPISQTTLFKVDADSLEVLAEVTPEAAADGRGLNAVYGVGVDDARGLVWVTNTRQNSVSVYKASDLSLIKQFDAGSSGHARDVVVDEQTGLAYVSTPVQGRGYLDVYDGNTLEQKSAIELPDMVSPMSLDFIPETGELFTVDMNNARAAKIDVRDGNKVTYFNLPEESVVRGSGITFDPVNRNIWVATQASSNVVVWNVDRDELVADLPTGGGALNATYDPVNKLVYVINRGGGNLNVFDAGTREMVGNLPVGGNANHVATDGRGNVYTVNKLNEEINGENFNSLYKITPKGGQSDPVKPVTPKPPTQGSSNGGFLAGLLGALGLGGALLGIANFLFTSGVVPVSMIPPQLRALLNI